MWNWKQILLWELTINSYRTCQPRIQLNRLFPSFNMIGFSLSLFVSNYNLKTFLFLYKKLIFTKSKYFHFLRVSFYVLMQTKWRTDTCQWHWLSRKLFFLAPKEWIHLDSIYTACIFILLDRKSFVGFFLHSRTGGFPLGIRERKFCRVKMVYLCALQKSTHTQFQH